MRGSIVILLLSACYAMNMYNVASVDPESLQETRAETVVEMMPLMNSDPIVAEEEEQGEDWDVPELPSDPNLDATGVRLRDESGSLVTGKSCRNPDGTREGRIVVSTFVNKARFDSEDGCCLEGFLGALSGGICGLSVAFLSSPFCVGAWGKTSSVSALDTFCNSGIPSMIMISPFIGAATLPLFLAHARRSAFRASESEEFRHSVMKPVKCGLMGNTWKCVDSANSSPSHCKKTEGAASYYQFIVNLDANADETFHKLQLVFNLFGRELRGGKWYFAFVAGESSLADMSIDGFSEVSQRKIDLLDYLVSSENRILSIRLYYPRYAVQRGNDELFEVHFKLSNMPDRLENHKYYPKYYEFDATSLGRYQRYPVSLVERSVKLRRHMNEKSSRMVQLPRGIKKDDINRLDSLLSGEMSNSCSAWTAENWLNLRYLINQLDITLLNTHRENVKSALKYLDSVEMEILHARLQRTSEGDFIKSAVEEERRSRL